MASFNSSRCGWFSFCFSVAFEQGVSWGVCICMIGAHLEELVILLSVWTAGQSIATILHGYSLTLFAAYFVTFDPPIMHALPCEK